MQSIFPTSQHPNCVVDSSPHSNGCTLHWTCSCIRRPSLHRCTLKSPEFIEEASPPSTSRLSALACVEIWLIAIFVPWSRHRQQKVTQCSQAKARNFSCGACFPSALPMHCSWSWKFEQGFRALAFALPLFTSSSGNEQQAASSLGTPVRSSEDPALIASNRLQPLLASCHPRTVHPSPSLNEQSLKPNNY